MRNNSLFVLLFTVLFVSACKKSEDPAPAAGRTGQIYVGSFDQNPVPQFFAELEQPKGIVFDRTGNFYIVDNGVFSTQVLKISPAGIVSVLGSLTGHSEGIAIDAADNLYLTDQYNNVIRKITPEGVMTILAGSGDAGYVNGTGTEASFNQPAGVAVDTDGNVFVADKNNRIIRKITPEGVVTTYAGSGSAGSSDGSLLDASFTLPYGITVDAAGTIYVTDAGNSLVRTIKDGYVFNAVDEQRAGVNTFHEPRAIAVDASGNLYVTDIYDWVIRKIDRNGHPAVFYGIERTNQPSLVLAIRESYGIAIHGSYIYASDAGFKWVMKFKK